MLTGRTLTAEHMDDPGASREQLATALGFLRLVNARLGGAAATLRILREWSRHWPRPKSKDGRSATRILDIGAGSADVPLAIVRWARGAGHDVHVTAVDRHPVTVELAREFIAREARDGDERGRISIVQADALRLMEMFGPESFDCVHASLFLHHLGDVEVATMLRIMDRLARRGMIWNDLVRSGLSALAVRLATLGAPAIVRHDALVSERAGFTKAEALDLARRAGWREPLRYRRRLAYRFTLSCAKPQ